MKYQCRVCSANQQGQESALLLMGVRVVAKDTLAKCGALVCEKS